LAALVLALVLGGGAWAADAPSQESHAGPGPAESSVVAPAAAIPEPPAIPIPEIPERIEQTTTRLRELLSQLESSTDLGALEAAVSEGGNRVWTGATNTNLTIQQGVGLANINDFTQAWKEGRGEIAERSAALTEQTGLCQDVLDEIKTLRSQWTRAGEAVLPGDVPAEIRTQIDAVVGELAKGAEQVVALRDRLVVLQAQTARQLAVTDEVLARLDQLKTQQVGRLGVRGAAPLWQGWLDEQARGAASGRIEREARNELRFSAYFLMKHPYFIPIHVMLFTALAMLLRRIRTRTAVWKREGVEVRDQLAVLDLPYSVAFVLTTTPLLFDSGGIPRSLLNLLGTLFVVPVLRIANRFLAPALLRLVYVLVSLRIVERLLELVSPSQLVEQTLLCVTLMAGLLLLAWSVRLPQPGGARSSTADGSRRSGLRAAVGLIAADFAVALVAAVLGYLQLARLLFDIPLWMSNATLLFYTAARVVLGLWAVLLEATPLASLRMVETHRELIARRSRSVVVVLAVAGWLLALRNNFAFAGFTGGSLEKMAAASAHFGSVTISVGELVAALVTVWASVLLSRFIRFVLEEELFPRVHLAEGVPYALSMLTHYTILAAGMLLGLATLGFDPSRLTVIVGALGVGIGFGLQTIVNNLSSGLILLFERPIKVGDTVQVGAVTGEVKRIGPRSSTVRTGDGAEMIVPNATLVSETVTNWTLSDHSRRFELSVGVAYGTDTARVMTILKDTATAHADVLRDPGPVALFTGFGESSLDFQLKAWVGDGSRLSTVKSEVGLALCNAFDVAGIEIPFPQRQVHIAETKEPQSGADRAGGLRSSRPMPDAG
jgi:small-conductance mechanosensitive channel